LPPTLGTKALYFCGTTQFGASAPTPFAYQHMHPIGNGRGSRRRLLPYRFWAALAGPFRSISATAFSPASGSLSTAMFSYFSCSSVYS